MWQYILILVVLSFQNKTHKLILMERYFFSSKVQITALHTIEDYMGLLSCYALSCPYLLRETLICEYWTFVKHNGPSEQSTGAAFLMDCQHSHPMVVYNTAVKLPLAQSCLVCQELVFRGKIFIWKSTVKITWRKLEL